MSWTQEKYDYAKALWQQGKSATQIAAKLGEGCTRNSVLGKLHREAQKNPDATMRRRRPTIYQRPRKPRAPSTPRHNNHNRAVITNLWSQGCEADGMVDTIVEADDPPPEARLSVLNLNGHTCRWPIGDPRQPDFGHCGAEPLAHLPYCARHARQAYRPARERPYSSWRN